MAIFGDNATYVVPLVVLAGDKTAVELLSAPAPGHYAVVDINVYCDGTAPGAAFALGIYEDPAGGGPPAALVANSQTPEIAAPAPGAPAWVTYTYKGARPLLDIPVMPGAPSYYAAIFVKGPPEPALNLYESGAPAGTMLFNNVNVAPFPALDDPFGACGALGPLAVSFYLSVLYIPTLGDRGNQRIPSKQDAIIRGRNI